MSKQYVVMDEEKYNSLILLLAGHQTFLDRAMVDDFDYSEFVIEQKDSEIHQEFKKDAEDYIVAARLNKAEVFGE